MGLTKQRETSIQLEEHYSTAYIYFFCSFLPKRQTGRHRSNLGRTLRLLVGPTTTTVHCLARLAPIEGVDAV